MFETTCEPGFGHPTVWQQLCQLDTLIASVLAAPKGKASSRAHRRTILLLLFSKGLKTYNAIGLLCSYGYGQDALLLLRSFFDLVLTAQYLTQVDSRKRVAQFRAYHNFIRAKLPQPRPNPHAARQDKQKAVRSQRLIVAAAARAKKRYPYFRAAAMGWTGLSLEAVAKAVGQQDTYDYVYRLGSQYEHPTFYAVYSYAMPDRLSIAESSAPSSKFVDEILATLFYEMLLLLGVIVHAFQLPMRAKLRQTSSLLAALLEVIRNKKVTQDNVSEE